MRKMLHVGALGRFGKGGQSKLPQPLLWPQVCPQSHSLSPMRLPPTPYAVRAAGSGWAQATAASTLCKTPREKGHNSSGDGNAKKKASTPGGRGKGGSFNTMRRAVRINDLSPPFVKK
jgi:hypothetical protein